MLLFHRLWKFYTIIFSSFLLKRNLKKQESFFDEMIPALSFAHQHIDISIKFYKTLRVEEGIFETNFCRSPIKNFDQFQNDEAKIHLDKIIKLQNNLLNN
jgi:hypothetical protein